MYSHLLCSPELFAVASARKSARKFFRPSLELMVLKDHEPDDTSHLPPMPFIDATFTWAYHFV